MNPQKQFQLLYNPTFRVTTTWVFDAAITILIFLMPQEPSFFSAAKVLEENGYLFTYIEIAAVGLLPIIFTLVCKDDLTQYGLTHRQSAKSVLLSGLLVIVMFGGAYLMRGKLMTDNRPALHVEFPLNIWYGVLGIFAWGPLEVFFVAWLITNTDQIFKDGNKLFSRGLTVTLIGIVALHVLTTNAANALYTGGIFLALTLIYKRTQNTLGPMLAWTLINGQVWYMARLLL